MWMWITAAGRLARLAVPVLNNHWVPKLLASMFHKLIDTKLGNEAWSHNAFQNCSYWIRAIRQRLRFTRDSHCQAFRESRIPCPDRDTHPSTMEFKIEIKTHTEPRLLTSE